MTDEKPYTGRWRVQVGTLDGFNDLLYTVDKYSNKYSFYFDTYTKLPDQLILLDGFSVIRLAHFKKALIVEITVKQIAKNGLSKISEMISDLSSSWKVTPIKDVVCL